MSVFNAIGIDLGTTRSSVSYINEAGRTEMLQNGHDEIFTPSVVLFDGDARIVGREAERQAAFAPDRVVSKAKLEMGLPFLSSRVCGRRVPPEVIQACILRSLRSDILQHMMSDYQAVITVPAYFDESRRTATLNAAAMAEVAVLDIVNEPTAAALAFGERLGYLTESGTTRTTMHVLVYDLGGGTFDVSVMRMSPGNITTIATDGDMRLGGADWDNRLVDLLAERAQISLDSADSAKELFQLRTAAIAAKHTLSSRREAVVHFGWEGQSYAVEITRNEFQTRTRDLVERTAFTTRQVLQASKLTWSDIGRVLMVGGSTRIPAIRQMVESAYGKPPDDAVNPDEAVARGAAIFAQYRLGIKGMRTVPGNLTITDVNAHSLGIEGINMATERKENTHIIPRNTPLPFIVQRKFVTKKENQSTIQIKVLEGEGNTADGCITLGRSVIRNLPPGLPQGHPILVEYSYNTNGRLSVRARVPGYGSEAIIELQRTRDLSDTRLAAWKKVVCSDGGFREFEVVLDTLFGNSPLDNIDSDVRFEIEATDDIVPSSPTEESSGDPGASPAAAAILRQHESPTFERPTQFRLKPARSGRSSRLWLFLAGHVIASCLGLALGYYLLVWANPAANFLQLDLPGVSTPQESAPAPP